MSRQSKVTSPISVEINFVPDAEKVEQAKKIAAVGYKRALIKQLKEEKKKPTGTEG